MQFANASLDATLAAAAGEDPALLEELRCAFAESVERQLDLLQRARCDGNWTMAAMRLRGLAASFHAEALIALADEALAGAPGEPGVLRRIGSYHREFTQSHCA